MSSERARIAELTGQARGLPHGSTKVALLEEAVRLADTLNDIPRAYEVRQQLIEAACFANQSDILLVAFSWCLAQYDRDPSQFSAHQLLWEYKWVTSSAREFPEISRARLDALHHDMERRFRAAGYSMYAVWKLRRELAMFYGEHEAAREAHAKFRRARRDGMSDCGACVSHADMLYFRSLGEWDRAVEAAEPVLQNKIRCSQEPHRTLADVLLPLLQLGRVDEAREYQARGYRLVSGAPHFIRQHAGHLQFMTLVGSWVRARGMLERHLPSALRGVEKAERFTFLLAGQLWADRMLGRGTKRVKLRLPEGLPAPDAKGTVDLAELRAWFHREAGAIADQFDARAGTTAFRDQMAAHPELLRLAIDETKAPRTEPEASADG